MTTASSAYQGSYCFPLDIPPSSRPDPAASITGMKAYFVDQIHTSGVSKQSLYLLIVFCRGGNRPASLPEQFRESITFIEEPVANDISSSKLRQLLAEVLFSTHWLPMLMLLDLRD